MKSLMNMVGFEREDCKWKNIHYRKRAEKTLEVVERGQYFLRMIYTAVNWYCHPCLHVLAALPSPGYPRVPKCTSHIPAM